jgi:hypothetical protein
VTSGGRLAGIDVAAVKVSIVQIVRRR